MGSPLYTVVLQDCRGLRGSVLVHRFPLQLSKFYPDYNVVFHVLRFGSVVAQEETKQPSPVLVRQTKRNPLLGCLERQTSPYTSKDHFLTPTTKKRKKAKATLKLFTLPSQHSSCKLPTAVPITSLSELLQPSQDGRAFKIAATMKNVHTTETIRTYPLIPDKAKCSTQMAH